MAEIRNYTMNFSYDITLPAAREALVFTEVHLRRGSCEGRTGSVAGGSNGGN